MAVHTTKHLFVASSLLMLTACDRVFRHEPKANDLVGTYSLTADSKTFLIKRKGYKSNPESTIELRSDYSIIISNLPDEGQLCSGHGTWKLEKGFIGYGLTLDISKGGSLPGGIYAGPWIHILHRSPPHVLEITVGDPDSGETIRYERKRS